MKTAIVHEWLTALAGSEKVVEQMCNAFQPQKLFVLVDHIDGARPDYLCERAVQTSFIQQLPFAKNRYRGYLPLMPMAVEQFDLSEYELVLSSHHCVAHGVITGPDQLHIAYTHSPMRYIWDLQHQYFSQSGLNKKWLRRKLAHLILHYLRIWDRAAGGRPDYFVANSRFVASRIRKFYGREATVIYPPVDVESFVPGESREDYYLTASRFVPYKMLPLIVGAFAKRPDRKLIVIGDGPERERVERIATSNVELLGYQSNESLTKHLQSARAFVYAAEEDFGILPVEAQACGAPVIALGRGGTKETVLDGESGVHFSEQNEDSLLKAIEKFECLERKFDAARIRANAERFSTDRFHRELSTFVDRCQEEFQTSKRCEQVEWGLNSGQAILS